MTAVYHNITEVENQGLESRSHEVMNVLDTMGLAIEHAS